MITVHLYFYLFIAKTQSSLLTLIRKSYTEVIKRGVNKVIIANTAKGQFSPKIRASTNQRHDPIKKTVKGYGKNSETRKYK